MTDSIRERFYGEVLGPDETTYDETREIWNAMIDRRPAVIARCTGAADVITAVNFARENDRLVALKDEYDPANLFRLNQNVTPTS